jgi:hypothetical protein
MSVVLTLTASPYTAVTIHKNPSFSSDYFPRRLNHKTISSADGGRATYDNGPEEIIGVLVIKNVNDTDKAALETFLRQTAIYGLNSFSITPPSNTNVGAGKGVALASSYYNGGNTLEGVFTHNPPDIWDIKLPYRKLV